MCEHKLYHSEDADWSDAFSSDTVLICDDCEADVTELKRIPSDEELEFARQQRAEEEAQAEAML